MTDSRMIGGEGRASALALSRKFQRKELFELQHGGLRTAKRLARSQRARWKLPSTLKDLVAEP
jgi:hypothetical protein